MKRKLKTQCDAPTSQIKGQVVANVDKDVKQLDSHTPQVGIRIDTVTLENH